MTHSQDQITLFTKLTRYLLDNKTQEFLTLFNSLEKPIQALYTKTPINHYMITPALSPGITAPK